MLIREVILENFMSYEYARVPLKPGVNVICGPNGAGKSSILLGISVALGQSYTERSKRLSDLIRWGKDQARVTLVLDNSRRKGRRRPVPKFNKDQLFLTRVLRRDGKYWFELENRAATKGEVQRLLARLGVNPENMLIIMHQNMVEQFTVLSPQEKLSMVEAAVGLESYRRNVLEARRKLSRILSQEESVNKLLESAEQTLNYWREQYDRYQQKKQLQIKRRFLERELAWAEVAKRERAAEEIETQMKELEKELREIKEDGEAASKELLGSQEKLESLRAEWRKLLEERVQNEREKAKRELNIAWATQSLEEERLWEQKSRERISEALDQIEKLEGTLQKQRLSSQEVAAQIAEIKRTYKNMENEWSQRLSFKTQNLKKLIETSTQQLAKLNQEISNIEAKTKRVSLEMEESSNRTVDCKIKLALLEHRKREVAKSLKRLERELRTARLNLSEAVERAEQTGPRLVPVKSLVEILDEIRVTDGHLAALADVSEDVERMYESYSKLYLELKKKAKLVEENREKTLEEVRTRMEAWRTVMQRLLDRVNLKYQAILAQTQASGEVRLVDAHDIEAAGLEILVGFKGAKPVPLDAYTQSGGERSTATMSFLLALQQHVRSPFRAVDEYDIHMDPKNRETIANMLISSVKGTNAQYVLITPSRLSFSETDVHIITVQNVEGTSIVRNVRK